jgi:hypothetical protein
MASAPSEGPRPSLTPLLQRLHELWEKVPGTLPFILLGMLVLLAFWDSRKHVTTIAPFQVPKADLPFTGEMVSDALQDGLESMHNEIEFPPPASSGTLFTTLFRHRQLCDPSCQLLCSAAPSQYTPTPPLHSIQFA